MSNIKFSQLPDQGAPTDATIMPTVAGGVNYTVTGANLKSYVNSTTGNITGGNITATGNVTGTYILGNGSQLTGIVSTYGNSNVAAYLPVNSANIQANFISAIGNVTGAYLLGNGSQITGLPANYGNTQVATFLAAFGSNAVSTTGNVTAGYVFGNISGATGGYGNSNVQTVLQTYSGTMTAGSLSTTGNIAGLNFIGNGSALTGITASLSGTMSGNINGNGFQISNVSAVTATGNITGTHFGSGSNLTGIPTSILAGSGISVSAATGAVTITNNNPNPYTNANVAAYLPTYTGVLAGSSLSVTGNVLGANITGTHFGSGGNLSNVVTSIIAGAGVSINSSTGAVTITSLAASNYVDLTTNQTVAGNKTFTGTTTLGPYVETTAASVNSSTSFTPVMSTGPVQKITATANFALNAPTGMTTGQSITLIITQDATGGRIMTPNAAYKFAYSVNTLSLPATSIDVMSIFYDGTNYLCNLVKGYV
jgi:hypothetical protein